MEVELRTLLLWASAVAAMASVLINFRDSSVAAVVMALAFLAILRELKVEQDDRSGLRRSLRIATSCVLGLLCLALDVGPARVGTLRLVTLAAVCVGVLMLASIDVHSAWESKRLKGGKANQ